MSTSQFGKEAADGHDADGASPDTQSEDQVVWKKLGPGFTLNNPDDAAILFLYIRRQDSPSLTLSQTLTLVNNDRDLYNALKVAFCTKQLDKIRDWYLIPNDASDANIHTLAEIFLEELRPDINDLIDCSPEFEPRLNFWRPDTTFVDEDTATFLTGLKIPLLMDGPSLLLHELGKFQDNPELSNRLRDIFSENMNTFLVNSSGSGKTRLTAEGLCVYWGFYFSALADLNLWGSRDLYRSIKQTLPHTPGFSRELPTSLSPSYEGALSLNRNIANRVFSQVLLARLLIFDLFLRVMTEKRLSMANAGVYKTRWLLLQLFPTSRKYGDIFHELTKRLAGASTTYLDAKVSFYLEQTRISAQGEHLTDQQLPPFFCVIDEAQYAASQHFSAFRSEGGSAVPRPVLREITRCWVGSSFEHLRVIISGTGISNEAVDHAFASAHNKQSVYRWCSNTGAFDNPTAQREYLCKYTPPWVMQSQDWGRLLERMWHWCHGRHRSTSAFLELLMRNGFKNPHRLLNAYVFHNCGFQPTDAEECVKREKSGSVNTDALIPRSINFARLERDASKRSIVESIVSSFFLRGVITQALGTNDRTSVILGFANFPGADAKTVTINEPLYILAAVNWMKERGDLVYRQYADRLDAHSNWFSSNGFENFIAYGIYLLFGEPRPFCEVVKFHGSVPAWAKQPAQLVSFYRPTEDGRVEEAEVGPNSFRGPCATIGISATSPEETLQWLNHQTPAPICFPAKDFGPDIVCILRFADGTTAWWTIQAKLTKGENGVIRNDKLKHAIKSLHPLNYFTTKEGNPEFHSRLPNLINDTRQRLEALSRRRPDLGLYSVIRTVAVFPADPDFGRASNLDEDYDGHPLVELNMNAFHQATKHLKPENILMQFSEMSHAEEAQKRSAKLAESTNVMDSGRPTSARDELPSPRRSKRQRSPQLPDDAKRLHQGLENEGSSGIRTPRTLRSPRVPSQSLASRGRPS